MIKNKNIYLIANFGEIFLKGGNIGFFEEKLFFNFLEKTGDLKKKIVFEKKTGGAFFMKLDLNISEEEILIIENIIKNTPGFANYYRAYFCKTDLEEISNLAAEMAIDWFFNQKQFSNKQGLNEDNHQGTSLACLKTFGIATEKNDKGIKIKTKDININTGSAVWKAFKEIENDLTVNLDNPDLKINIKVKQGRSFIFLNKKKAVGGLPIGSTGNAIALFSGGIDSPVAAFLAMKRGLNITAVHFHSVPQTSKESIEKVKRLIKELSKFQKNIKLYLIPIIAVQKNIVKNADRKLSIVLQRRAFLKMAKMISDIEKENKKQIEVFISGDSLGQVASQTTENIITVSEVLDNTGKIIFRPLLTYDKVEIMDLARKIGTLSISEEPHEDTCSLFVPEKPATKAKIEYTKKEELKLNDGDILLEAIEKLEIFEV